MHVGPRARVLRWKWVAYVSIPIHVYISFFIEVCLHDSNVTGPSVHTPHDSACLSAPLKWSCLVRHTIKGWERWLSRNVALHIICKNKPSGQRYLKRIYIKQLQKQASVCRVVMQQDHTTSLNLFVLQDKEIEKSVEKSLDYSLLYTIPPQRKNRRLLECGKGSSSRQVKVGAEESPNKSNWDTHPVAGTSQGADVEGQEACCMQPAIWPS